MLRAVIAAAFPIAGLTTPAFAQSSFTWDGGDGSSQAWSTAGNWNPDGAPANNFLANFIFGGAFNTGTSGAPLNNDLTGGNITNLTFNAGASTFYLSGNTVTNWGGITNNSGVPQVINFGMVISTNNPTSTSPHWINVGSGSITNGGTVIAPTGNATIAKIGPGTLVFNSPLTNTLGNGTPGGNPFIAALNVDEGTVIFDGGPTSVYNLGGESAFGRLAPTGNKNVTVIMQSGRLNSTTWMGIGRGNGAGEVSSDLILNGSSVYSPVNWSGCFNAGDATRRPRGTVVQNGTSLFFVNNNNANNNFAESAGAYVVHTLNDSSTLRLGSGADGSAARARVGIAGRQIIKIASPTATATWGQTHIGDAAGGAGAVYNRGIFSVTSAASTDHFAVGSASGGATPANNAYGYYLHDSATALTLREIGVGGANNGDGVLEVKQGLVNVNTWITHCRGQSTTVGAQQSSLLMIRNGTVMGPNVNQNYMLQSGSGISQYAVMDIGAGGKLGSLGTAHFLNMANANNALSFSTLTLSGGGIIEINRINGAQPNPLACINFNNGKLIALVNSAAFIGNNIDGVFIHAGGATIDTAGFDVSTIPTLQAPTASGITSIPVATPGVDYIGRPIVRITDATGIGATAIADWNEASGTITGITITSPGSGYSAPTVTLVGGGFTNAATLGTPVLGTPASGGLTKIGAGALTLLGGATYTGPTVLSGGTLVLNPLQPFSSSGLTISNAVLNLDASSGVSLNVGSLTLQNNTTNNLSYGVVAVNPNVPAIAASGSISAPGSGIVINIDGFGLQPGQFTLIDYTGAPLPNLANFSLGNLPPGVVATLSNNTANTSIDIVITSSGQNLTWFGSDAATGLINPNWDIATTTNWVLYNTTTPTRYQEYTTTTTVGDPVRFDDTLTNDFINPQPTNVNLTTTVRPFRVTVDSLLPYSLTGPGGLAGVTTILKSNVGSFFLGTSNVHTGGTFLYGGALAITNDTALGNTASAVTLGSGTLQILADITNTRPIAIVADSPINVSNGVTARLGGRFTGTSRALFRDLGTAIITNTTSLPFHIAHGTVIFEANAKITNTLSFASVGLGTTAAEDGRLTIRNNATFDITTDFNIGDTIDAQGRVDLQNNAQIRTANLWLGKFDGAQGRFFQSGGTLTNSPATGADWRFGGENAAAAGSFGGFYLSGGRVDAQKNTQIGANGTGELIMTGGTWNQWGGFPVVGRFATGIGTMAVAGGQFNHFATGSFLIIGENGVGSLTISNAGVVSLTNALRVGFAAGGQGTVNLLTGGKLIAAGVLTSPNGVSSTFNFNGGTLQANSGSTAFLQDLTTANVLSGGAIIDSSSNNITIGQPLLDGGGGLTKLGTGVLFLTGSNTYSGTTLVSEGRLLVAPAHHTTGPVSVANNAGFGAFVNGPGTATLGNVTLGSGGATSLELVLTTGSNPVVAPLQTATLTVNGTATVRLSGKIAVGTFPILTYSGAIGGSGTLNSVVTGPQGMVASLSNHVAGSTLYVTVTSIGPGLVWTGNNATPALTNLWDLNSTTNWLSGASPTFYQEIIPPGDAVTFNNIGTGVVLLNRVASPSSVLFDNSINYSLSGTGRISGTTGLLKQNSGTTTLSIPGNDYTGDTTVSGGTLRLGNATSIPDGNSAGYLIIGAAGTVDLNGFSETLNGLTGTGNINNTAGGVVTMTVGNGNKASAWGGTLDSTAGIILTKVGTNTLTISGPNTFRNGNSTVNAGTTIITNGGAVINTTGEFWVANGANTIATNIIDGGLLVTSNNWIAIGRGVTTANGTMIVNNGVVKKTGGTGNNIVVGSLAATGTLIVNGGQVLNDSQLWLGENTGANAWLFLNGGLVQASQVRPNGTTPTTSQAYFNGGILQATANSADFILSTAIIQAGGLKLDSGTFTVTLASQVLNEDFSSPGGGLVKLGSGTLVLNNVETYSGPTIVSNGTLRVDGSIGGVVNVKSGATLGGVGSVGGVVTVEPGGSIGAGASIGTLTLNSSPVLGGRVVAEVDRNSGSSLSDLINVATGITYGGTLVMTNTGAPLQVGDTFTLFSATGYGGGFASVISQAPGQLVTWNTNNLTVNGSISVASVGPLSPPTLTNSVSGNNLNLSWANEYLGWILQAQTNTAGISTNWVDVPGSGGATTATMPVNKANPPVFLRLRSP